MSEDQQGEGMAEIWVSMLSCSECLRYHDEVLFPESYDPDCDCWCHDGDMDLDDPGDFEYG